MTAFESGAATDVGQVRAHNEDTFVVAGTVFVVPTAWAATTAVRCLPDRRRSPRRHRPGQLIDDLVRGVQEANADILERAREQPEFRGMGTTVVMLPTSKRSHRLGVANVGDSRLYRLTDSGLHQHTEDHSLVEALVVMVASPEPKPQCTRSATSCRALGIDDKVLVDAWELIPVVGDRYVLCSDGLFGEIDDDEIHEVLQATSSPQDAADELVRRAREAGGATTSPLSWSMSSRPTPARSTLTIASSASTRRCPARCSVTPARPLPSLAAARRRAGSCLRP